MGVFNMIIPGKFVANKGGHKLHIELITKLWEKYAKENFSSEQMFEKYKRLNAKA